MRRSCAERRALDVDVHGGRRGGARGRRPTRALRCRSCRVAAVAAALRHLARPLRSPLDAPRFVCSVKFRTQMQAGNDITAAPDAGEGAAAPWNAVRCRDGVHARPRRELFPEAQRPRGPPRALGEGHDPRPRRRSSARRRGLGDRVRSRGPPRRGQAGRPALACALRRRAVSTSRSRASASRRDACPAR